MSASNTAPSEYPMGIRPEKEPTMPANTLEDETTPELPTDEDWKRMAKAYGTLCAAMHEDRRRMAFIQATQTTILIELRTIRQHLQLPEPIHAVEG